MNTVPNPIMWLYSAGNWRQFAPRKLPNGAGHVGGEQEREQDRADAEQPPDRALRKPEYEEAQEVQRDHQIDSLYAFEECPEVHYHPSTISARGGAGAALG